MHQFAEHAEFLEAELRELRANAEVVVGVRRCVLRFAVEMERKLRANDHKGGWDDDEVEDLLARIPEETAELERALERYYSVHTQGPDEVVGEAADVANFAMMVADRIGPSHASLEALTVDRAAE